MKTMMIVLLTTGLACSAFAQSKAQLNKRIDSLTAKFTAMQQNPSKRVPADELAKAKGIVLLDRTKGGFIFAYHGGNGIAMVKNTATGNWSPAAFVSSTGASLGFQAGGEQDFYVILLMSTNATQALTQQNINFGAQVSETGGTQNAGAQANTASPTTMVYSQHNGVFGGAAVKGGAISPDNDANQAYYGRQVSMQDILFNHAVQPTSAEENLMGKIGQYAK